MGIVAMAKQGGRTARAAQKSKREGTGEADALTFVTRIFGKSLVDKARGTSSGSTKAAAPAKKKAGKRQLKKTGQPKRQKKRT